MNVEGTDRGTEPPRDAAAEAGAEVTEVVDTPDPEAAARGLALSVERSVVEAALRLRTADLVRALSDGADVDAILGSMAKIVGERDRLDAFARGTTGEDDGPGGFDAFLDGLMDEDDGEEGEAYTPPSPGGVDGEGRADGERPATVTEASEGARGPDAGTMATGTAGRAGVPVVSRAVGPSVGPSADGTLDAPPFGRETGDDGSVVGPEPATPEEVGRVLQDAGSDLSLEDVVERVVATRGDLVDATPDELKDFQRDVLNVLYRMSDGADGPVAADWPRPGRFAAMAIVPMEDRASL